MTTSSEHFVFSLLDGAPSLVGRLETTGGGRPSGRFAYAASWLAAARRFPIEPERYPLAPGAVATGRRGGLPGPVADTLPDAWGRRIIALAHPRLYRHFDLLAVVEDGAGVLRVAGDRSFDPAASRGPAPADLPAIEEAFRRIDRNEPVDDRVKALFTAGQSLGGARPKTVVDLGGESWIAKFSRRDDRFDVCAVEHAAMAFGASLGMDFAETRLHDLGARKAVLVRRFDRLRGVPSAHVFSALSALDLDDTDGRGGYPDVAAYIRRHAARPAQDGLELFRRMVFNALIGNRDDHLKNHGFLWRDGLRLSPAYDVLPQPDMEAMQAIAIGDVGRLASDANMISQAPAFQLSARQAIDIVAAMREAVRGWRPFFSDHGVDRHALDAIAPAFAA